MFISPHSQWSVLFTVSPLDGAEILSMLQGQLCRMCTFEYLYVCDYQHWYFEKEWMDILTTVCCLYVCVDYLSVSSPQNLCHSHNVSPCTGTEGFSLSGLLLLEVRVGQDLMLWGRLLRAVLLQGPAVKWHFRCWGAELVGLSCTLWPELALSFLFAFSSHSIFLSPTCPSVSSPVSLSLLSLLISPLALRSICAPHSPYAPCL